MQDRWALCYIPAEFAQLREMIKISSWTHEQHQAHILHSGICTYKPHVKTPAVSNFHFRAKIYHVWCVALPSEAPLL